MITKKSIGLALSLGAALAASGTADAFSLLSRKWDVGVNTAMAMSGNEGTPGGATWSVMAAGLAMESSAHSGSSFSTNLGLLLGGPTLAEEIAAITWAIDTWAAVSNFTNLGMAADGNSAAGAPEASGGHLGDIRFGASAGFSSGVLAHAWTPGIEGVGAPGTVGGDVHFNNIYSWVDDPNDPTGNGLFDFYTVALHEVGHALGLGHSSVSGSIMEPVYAGGRRTLHADDIAGIQTIYGAAPVPEPFTMVLGAASLGVAALRRRRSRAA